MLTDFKVQFQLPVIIGLFLYFRLEQFLDDVLYQEGTSQNPHNFIGTSVEFKRFFDDCNSTVRNDSYIILDSYSIFRISPKALDSQMTLYPFEKCLYSPSVFIEKGDVFSFQIEVVRIIRERSFELWFIIYNPSDFRRKIFSISLCCESHSPISEDIIRPLQKVFSCNQFKQRPAFFSYNEERILQLYSEHSFQISVATVKNITSKRFIINPIHGIHIMNSYLSNIERNGYLCHHIQLCMYLDARLSASKSCPFEKRHTEVYGGGIKSIELAIQYKLFDNMLFLSKFHHMISEFFKNMIIPKLVHLIQLSSVNWFSIKTMMKRLFGVSSGNIGEFPQAATTIQLSKL